MTPAVAVRRDTPTPVVFLSTDAPLSALLEAGHATLLAHGWRQGAYTNSRGEVCMSGAFRLAFGEHGYARVATQLAAALGMASIPAWNDHPGRTPEEVLAAFAAAIGRAHAHEATT